MILLLSLLSVATADDVVYVPAGDSVTASTASYLLPEPMFDKCLSDSRTLTELAAPGIEQCRSICDAALTSAQTALTVCQDQISLDTLRVTELIGENASLEAQVVKLKHQRTVAWAIAGSLVAGSATAIWATTQLP